MLPSGYLCIPSNGEYIVDHINFKVNIAIMIKFMYLGMYHDVIIANAYL